MIGIMTGVTDATMPNIMRGDGRGESTGRRLLVRIKLPHTIASKELTPSKKVLHRKTKGFKIYRAIIL
jgi:hypothetical protein